MSKQNLARRQLRAALNAIDELIPVPWDLQLLVERIAEQRGRPIRLLATEFPGGDVSGLWLPTDDADLICYDRDASPAVREQTIGHELGHLLMNHQLEDRSAGPAVARQLAAVAISPALIERSWPAPHMSPPSRRPPRSSAPACCRPVTADAAWPARMRLGG